MERWSDQIAVVTGASAGIGTAICDELIKNGVKVVGLARRKDRLDELSKRWPKQRFFGVPCDVTKEIDLISAFDWVKKTLGPISILVNNAGLAKAGNLLDIETNSLKTTLETNVLGLAIATQLAVKSMRENHIDGHVIMINSVAGHVVPPVPHFNIYPATKWAVTALTETVRFELASLGSKIKVTSISPGLVETEIFEANGFLEIPQAVELLRTMTSLKSKDVADMVILALKTAPHVQISELTVRPVGQQI